MHEGLHNAPKLYGSEVRERSTVTDFSSGLKEAGKVRIAFNSPYVPSGPVRSGRCLIEIGAQGFFYGYYDGITGLVREPAEGAKKEVNSKSTSSSVVKYP